MDPLIGAALIGSGSALAGGLMNNFLGGGGMSDTQKNDQRFMNDFAWKAALRNEDYMRRYLEIRSNDAHVAGLHPLAALGVNVASGPGAAAFVGSGEGNRRVRDFGFIPEMGQNISRALLAQKTADERMLAQAALEKTQAETDLVRAQADDIRNKVPGGVGNPPAPNPYGPGVMQGDVSQLPNAHMVYRGPYGYETQWTPDFAVSHMGRAMRGMLQDLHDVGRLDLYPKLKAIGQIIYGNARYRRHYQRGDRFQSDRPY